MDLHRTQFTMCTRWENGRTYLQVWPMRELKLFAAELGKDDEVAVEATADGGLGRKGNLRPARWPSHCA
jgi:hypothetical protein